MRPFLGSCVPGVVSSWGGSINGGLQFFTRRWSQTSESSVGDAVRLGWCRAHLRYVGLLHFVSCGVCKGGLLPENQVLGVAFEWDRKGSSG